MTNEEHARADAAKCAQTDISKGREANPSYWNASEGSAWADWYLAAYAELSKPENEKK